MTRNLEKTVNYEVEFREWVNQFSDMLYSYAMQRCSDTELAKDLVQDTFLAAWRNREKFKGEVSVKNWLFIILKSKLTDHYRRTASKIAVEKVREQHNDHSYFDPDEHWTLAAYPREWNGTLTDEYSIKEFMNVLRQCSGKLQQVQHSVFVMKYIDGLESDEICRELQISSANYWVLMHRAKVQLRACLQKNWITP